MPIQGPFSVECDEQFPYRVGVVGSVMPLADFDKSSREHRVQAVDPDTGWPMWVVDVMDFDPDARERTFRVKIAAEVQPVPPDAVDGLPVRPVYLEGLTVTPYLKDVGNGRQRLAYSLRASGLSAPHHGHRGPAASTASPSAGSGSKAV